MNGKNTPPTKPRTRKSGDGFDRRRRYRPGIERQRFAQLADDFKSRQSDVMRIAPRRQHGQLEVAPVVDDRVAIDRSLEGLKRNTNTKMKQKAIGWEVE